MPKDKSRAFLWTGLLLAAFVVRVFVAFYWDSLSARLVAEKNDAQTQKKDDSSPTFFFGDSDSYWQLGRAIAFRRPYEFDDTRHWRIFRTPGYPVVLAPIFLLFGENPPVIVARLQGACFGTLNVGLVGLLAWTLLRFPRNDRAWIPLLSGCIAAFDPALVFQSVLVLSEETFLTAALVQNLLAIQLGRHLGLLPFPSRDMSVFKRRPVFIEWSRPKSFGRLDIMKSSFWLSLATAATIYLRPGWYYYLPFALFIILSFRLVFGQVHEIDDFHYSSRANFFSWTKLVFATTATLCFTFLALEPWIARNYRLTGRFVPTSLQMGASLYDGLNPLATGASDMKFVDDFRKAEALESSESSGANFEVRLDERMKEAAINWARKHPRKTLELSLIKIYRLWAPLPRERAFTASFIKVCLSVSFIPVFFLGALGAIRSFGRKGAAWILLIPALYITGLHSIFVSSIRYRTPAMCGFAILASYWLISSLTLIIPNRQRSNESQRTTTDRDFPK